MIYCFPTIPDNIEVQKHCYQIRARQYEKGKTFNIPIMPIGCPVVFGVLILRENGKILAITI
jgi:hypothetical protein